MPYSFEQFFSKEPTGEGELSLFKGKHKLGLQTTFSGKWDEMKKRLLLEESLEFSNGQAQHRVWRFHKNGIYRWQGFCPSEAVGDVLCEVADNQMTIKFKFMFPVYQLIRMPVDVAGEIVGKSPTELDIHLRFSLLTIPFGEYIMTLRTA